MSAWFSKVFKSGQATGTSLPPSGEPQPAAEAASPLRRVLEAPVLADVPDTPEHQDGLRIKARLEPEEQAITFLPDCPVMPGHSFWCPDRHTANAYAPLAAALYDAGGVESVLLHDASITVTLDGTQPSMEAAARELGSQIRAHLSSRMPVVHPEILENMPNEETIRTALQRVIDDELNPGIAGHGGFIELNRVVGNTAYITMGGGCQGCAASSYTLKQGVHRAFRAAVPEVGAILDETDHDAGANPYFADASVLMGG